MRTTYFKFGFLGIAVGLMKSKIIKVKSSYTSPSICPLSQSFQSFGGHPNVQCHHSPHTAEFSPRYSTIIILETAFSPSLPPSTATWYQVPCVPLNVVRILMSCLIKNQATMCIKSCLPAFSIGKQLEARSRVL